MRRCHHHAFGAVRVGLSARICGRASGSGHILWECFPIHQLLHRCKLGLWTAVFGAWAWHHNLKEVRALINQTKLFIALNATTAVAWIMYFFALKNIEPAIVNTLYTGIGPIAVLVLAQLRISMAHRTDTSWTELLGHFGVLASLVAIAGVAVLDQSGLAGPSISIRIVAVTVAVIGGVIIAISHMIARRLAILASDRLR